MHKIPIMHLKVDQNARRHLFNYIISLEIKKKNFSHLNFTQEVSERHIILKNEVCVEPFGGDAALLLQGWTVVNASAAGALLNPGGGRGFCISCSKDPEQ